jgi:hypothetical protein
MYKAAHNLYTKHPNQNRIVLIQTKLHIYCCCHFAIRYYKMTNKKYYNKTKRVIAIYCEAKGSKHI